MLIFFRMIQAIGASLTMANSSGIVTDIFPANERGKAMGFTGTFVSLGSIAGSGLGGVLLSVLGCQSFFLVNLTIGLILVLFPVTMAIVAPFSGALSDKIGSELLTFLGLIVMVAAPLGFATLLAEALLYL
jgi:MFS family permease